MQHSTPPTFRRTAAVGATVALVAVSSMIGVGATAAVADTADTSASSTASTPAPATTAPTPDAVAPTAAPDAAAPTGTATPAAAPTGTVTPAAAPGTATTIGAQVSSGPDGTGTTWTASGGAVSPTATGGTIDAVPVITGGSLWTSAVVFDEDSTPLGGADLRSDSVLTSSVASDVLAWDADTKTWQATFPDAGARQLTLTSEGLSTSFAVRVTAPTAPTAPTREVTFAEQTSADQPLRFEVTAGDAFAHAFTATGGTLPLSYVLLEGPTAFPVPGDGIVLAPEGLELDGDSGVLRGTPTVAGEYDFQVMALNGDRAATQYVHVSVRPAVAAGVQLLVTDRSADPRSGNPAIWTVGVDGELRQYTAVDSDTSAPVDAVRVATGASLEILPTVLDRFGNPTSRDGATYTSSVAADEIVVEDDRTAVVTFPHASTHVVTASVAGASTAFTVDVADGAATAGTGQLAFTGADTSAPLAWAAGLLASGLGLAAFRLRRRRN